jgi:hypothetical protein
MGTKGWKRGLYWWHELREKGGKRERRGYTPEREARAQDRRRIAGEEQQTPAGEIGSLVKQRAESTDGEESLWLDRGLEAIF